MKQRIYIAYGSNMSEVQMARRCPDAVLSGTGRIRGYELLFKGSLTGCYATIEKKAGAFVPVVFWRISPADERRLDAYEGFPRFYYKKKWMWKQMTASSAVLCTSCTKTGGSVFRRTGIIRTWSGITAGSVSTCLSCEPACGTAGNGWKERGSGLSPWMTGKLRPRELKAPSSSSMMLEPSMYSGIQAAVLG